MPKWLINLLFPSRCKVCDKVIYIGKEACDGCNAELRPIPENIQLMLVSNPKINMRMGLKPMYDGFAAPYYHEDGSRKMIYSLKFRGRKDLVKIISAEMINTYNQYLITKDIDFICCVPSSFKSTFKRGYDHVKLLGKSVSKAIGLDLIHPLKLARKKIPQHTLSGKDRIENIKGAFLCTDEVDIKGKTLLVIDDILSTGATFNECAKVLKRKGAKRVYGLMSNANI